MTLSIINLHFWHDYSRTITSFPTPFYNFTWAWKTRVVDEVTWAGAGLAALCSQFTVILGSFISGGFFSSKAAVRPHILTCSFLMHTLNSQVDSHEIKLLRSHLFFSSRFCLGTWELIVRCGVDVQCFESAQLWGLSLHRFFSSRKCQIFKASMFSVFTWG